MKELRDAVVNATEAHGVDRAAAVDFSWDVPAREWELALRGLLAAERWKWWE